MSIPAGERSDLRCPHCAKALEVEPADGITNRSDQTCLHCGYRETVRPARTERITRSEVRELAAVARRLLLCPSCKNRRHRNCHASGCECPCKPRTQKGQS